MDNHVQNIHNVVTDMHAQLASEQDEIDVAVDAAWAEQEKRRADADLAEQGLPQPR